MITKFEVGDKVKFLNAVGGGIVKKVTSDVVYVEDETGFDMPMQPSELIRMADQQGVGKVFNDETVGSAVKLAKKECREPTLQELEKENQLLRTQNGNLHEQIKQLKSQVLSLQRTLARLS